MIKKILFFALALTILRFNVYSQEELEKEKVSTSSIQHEVVVTATRLETPAKEIASSVTLRFRSLCLEQVSSLQSNMR